MHFSELDNFSAVIEGLYRSALDPTVWPSAMDRLVGFVDGSGTFYVTSDSCTGRVVRSELTGVDPQVNQLYLGYYADKEVRMPGALRAGVGEVITEQDMIELRAFRRSEIYNELLLPFDIPYIMTVCTGRSLRESSNFVVERSAHQGPFERQNIERLQSLVPHLRLALQLRTAYEAAASGAREMSTWLNDQHYALIALDGRGRVRSLSPVAERLVRQKRFIGVHDRQLRALTPPGNAALALAMRRALQHLPGTVYRGARVTLTSGSESAVADVLAVHDVNTGLDEPIAVMIIMRSADLKAPSSSVIATTLGVTRAEARLIYELFERGPLDEAARALRISIHTARSQLHSVFAKTECHNQVQLIRRVACMSTGAF